MVREGRTFGGVEALTWNAMDIVLGALFAWSAWRGWRRGLIWALAMLAAIGVGIAAGAYGAEHLAAQVQDAFGWSPRAAAVAAFTAAFVVVGAGILFLAKLLETGVMLAAFGWANRLAGAGFSVARMALVVAAVLTLAGVVRSPDAPLPAAWREDSLLLPHVEALGRLVLPEPGSALR
jgi:membrane protein required for colicin V production